MLARHLLFLATRRPHQALLQFSGEAAPSQGASSGAPPPYVGPPQPSDWHKVQNRVDYVDEACQKGANSKDALQRDYQIYDDNRASYERTKQNYAASFAENRLSVEKNEKIGKMYYDAKICPDGRCNYGQDMVRSENAKNRQHCAGLDGQQQFFTLPSRRPAREAEPPRSVTPDITRGLGRGPLSAMHMLARHGRKRVNETANAYANNSLNPKNFNNNNNKNVQLQGRSRLVESLQQHHEQTPIDSKNRFVSPLGISAFGYRFFASSPVQETEKKSTEILRNSTISPIAANSGGASKSSMPTIRPDPAVAERLTLVGNNCPSPIPGSSGRNTPTQSSSGRNTPTNLSIISPTKSTMSNEELFAAIYKSKRRLNIRDDAETLSPASSTSSLAKAPPGTRHSWSPESHKTPEIPPTVQSPSATSRLDFKRLLLQQSVKLGPTRLSAAEQLRLSRQQCNQQQNPPQSHHKQNYQQSEHHYHQNLPQIPLAKVLSPRSAWRFQTPRTDVLSSTIIEDTAAEEKAMKPSPENPTPRPNFRRQLDLEAKPSSRSTGIDERTGDENRRNSCESDNRLATRPNARNDVAMRLISQQRLPTSDSQHFSSTPKLRQANGTTTNSPNPGQNVGGVTTYDCEARRYNNQLARAQFLAGVPGTNSSNGSCNNQRQSAYFEKRFRARSESPQPTIARSVARSPSAPTLETAL